MKKIKQPKQLVFLLPFIIGVLLYVATANHGYVLDDGLVILKNTYIQNGIEGIGKLFFHNYVHGYEGFNDGLYRPLSTITFALEYEWFELSPKASHIVNVILYGAICSLLFVVLKQLFSDKSTLLLMVATLLFTAHPVHNEVVANIKSRDELLALLNMLAAISLGLLYIQSSKPLHIALSLLFFALGLLSKESAVSFVAIIPLILYYKQGYNIKNMVHKTAPYLAMAALFVAWRTHIVGSMEREVDQGLKTALSNSLFASTDKLEQIATSLWIQVVYLLKLLFPHPLSHDYSFNMIPLNGIAHWKTIIALGLLAGLIYLAVKLIKQKSPIAFGILWYAFSLVIVANLFIYIGTTFGERFLFSPSIGFAIAITFALAKVLKYAEPKAFSLPQLFNQNKTFSIVILALLLAYSGKTVSRSFHWKSNLSLYTADINYAAESARANYNYGTELMQHYTDAKHYSEAVKHLNKAISIYPKYEDAYNNLALSYQGLLQYDNAVKVLEQLIKLKPNYYRAYFNLGYSYYKQDKYQKAISYFETYLNNRSDMVETYYLLGVCYGNLGDFQQAIKWLKQSRKYNPQHVQTLIFLGQAYGILKDNQNSLSYFLKAFELQPDNVEVNLNLGINYALLNQHQLAVKYFENVLTQQPNNVSALQKIANSYSLLGDENKVQTYALRLQQLK